jgi:putative pre-16S rRNA nuclease
MGLDLGTVRIGVALSDPLGMVASPELVIECTDRAHDLRRIAELVASTDAELVVVGMPTTLRGERGLAAQQVEQFVAELADLLDIPVTTWDERMTTAVAERALLEAGKSREARRGLRDKVAATVMLQSYLDAHRSP